MEEKVRGPDLEPEEAPNLRDESKVILTKDGRLKIMPEETSVGKPSREQPKLFEQDILAGQQYEDLHKSRYMEPEKTLMLAILEAAMKSFQKYFASSRDAHRMSFKDAEEWFEGKKTDSQWLFDFENICDHLNLNAEYIRKGLLRWKEERLAEKDLTGRKKKLPRSQ